AEWVRACGCVAGRHGHDEERDDLPVHGAVEPAERDEAQVHGVEHDLDRQQDRDQVLAQEHAGAADGEEERVDHEIVTERNHASPSRRASTTAPTMATRISTEVASNAKLYCVNSTRPISRTDATVAPSARPPTGDPRLTTLASAHPSSATSSTASTTPMRAKPGRLSGWVRSQSAPSSCGALSSITTNRNSTMMAPA